jgi:hypothetical protein
LTGVLDHFLYLLELHANNAHVVYSPLLSSQISQSFAANAFNVFQRSMHQIEIVRLCALWDSADLNKQNIPTVIELIDDNSIIDMLADELRSHWANEFTSPLNPSAPNAAEREAVRRAELAFANEEAHKARTELQCSIADARAFLASQQLASIMNIRDKHLAHSLESTRREKHGPIVPMKYASDLPPPRHGRFALHRHQCGGGNAGSGWLLGLANVFGRARRKLLRARPRTRQAPGRASPSHSATRRAGRGPHGFRAIAAAAFRAVARSRPCWQRFEVRP